MSFSIPSRSSQQAKALEQELLARQEAELQTTENPLEGLDLSGLELKDVLKKLVPLAVTTLGQVLVAPGATQAEKVSASRLIIQIAHGKEASSLKIDEVAATSSTILKSIFEELRNGGHQQPQPPSQPDPRPLVGPGDEDPPT